MAASPKGKDPTVPSEDSLGRPKIKSGRCSEEKRLLPLPGIKHLSFSPYPSHYPD